MREQGWVITDPYSPAWWGGAFTADEVVITAVLVQLTRWKRVEETLTVLREQALNDLPSMSRLDSSSVLRILRHINFKERKLKSIKALAYLKKIKGDDILSNTSELIGIKGIGEETALAISLFAGNVPHIPISKYVSIVGHRLLGDNFYEDLSEAVIGQEPQRKLYILKMMYAGLTSLGKTFCKPSIKVEPMCRSCLFNRICLYYNIRKNQQS